MKSEEYRAECRRQARERHDREYGGRASLPVYADEPSPRDTFGIEAKARDEWESSASLRAEFTCLEAFIAFRRAEAKGLVRILGRGRGA